VVACAPAHHKRGIACRLPRECALEHGVLAQAGERELSARRIRRKRPGHLVGAIVVPVDVASLSRAGEELDVVLAREQSHVVELRFTGEEDLHRPGEQHALRVRAQDAEEGGVDLMGHAHPGRNDGGR
jgi:hypothetical protein